MDGVETSMLVAMSLLLALLRIRYPLQMLSVRLFECGWKLISLTVVALPLWTGGPVVGFGTGLGELAVQGALTGLVLGPAQALALPARTSRRRRWMWATAAPPLWALGWTATTLAGIDVEAQYTVFGAAGALTYSALSGLLLIVVLPRTRVHADARPVAPVVPS